MDKKQQKLYLVLLHGWGVNSSYLENLKNQIIKHSDDFIEIILLDVPGFKDKLEKPWTIDDYILWLKKKLAHINDPMILVGHSNGGRLSINFAYKYPHRVKALVLIASAGIIPKYTFKHYFFFIIAKIGKVVFSIPILNYLYSSARKLLYRLARVQDYYKADPYLRETMKNLLRQDISSFLPRIFIPVLLLWGDQDRSTPIIDAYKMYNYLPNAKLIIYKGCKHSLPKDNFKIISKDLLNFVFSL